MNTVELRMQPVAGKEFQDLLVGTAFYDTEAKAAMIKTAQGYATSLHTGVLWTYDVGHRATTRCRLIKKIIVEVE